MQSTAPGPSVIEWEHRKPVCLLKKALYGHPESGGHWERHLEDAVIGLGGKPVEGHPSSYWFPDSRLLLTVYVDDLLLSGPVRSSATKDVHGDFWAQLSEKISIEEPEPLDRFLGRSHKPV